MNILTEIFFNCLKHTAWIEGKKLLDLKKDFYVYFIEMCL